MKQDKRVPFDIYEFVSRNNVTCFCSAPGIGKTTFLMNLMHFLSKKEKVSYISLGSTRQELQRITVFQETLGKDYKTANKWHIHRLRYAKYVIDLIDQIDRLLNSDFRPKILIIDDLSSFPFLVQEDEEYTAVDLLEKITKSAMVFGCKIVFTVPIRFSKVNSPVIQFRHWRYMDGGIGSADLSDAVIFLDRQGYYGDTQNRSLLHGQIAQAGDSHQVHQIFDLPLPLVIQG